MHKKKVRFFLGNLHSLRSKIIFSFAIIIFLLLSTIAILTINSIQISRQYHKIIYNVNYARALNEILETKIDGEIWDIIAGKKSFEEVNPYQTINKINNSLEFLSQNASSEENSRYIGVIIRTVGTLTMYIDSLREQTENNSLVAQMEATMEEIWGVSSLVKDSIMTFITVEIQNASVVNDTLQATNSNNLIAVVIVLFIAVWFIIFNVQTLMTEIQRPLKELEIFASEVARGNFYTKVETPEITELIGLTHSLNTMSDKLKKLMDDNIKKQQDLKKSEMQALQAQITPHFLYNTFDTIVWLAEEEKYQEVISVTRAFAGFFRISLSKGADWITVSQELIHAKHYLTIQQVRYRDILEYELFEDTSIENESMLKLLLQPLIENALYHGLKNKRGRGKISVRCERLEKGMSFEVSDTGIGIDYDKLIELRQTMEKLPSDKHKGYGLYNVNQRLRLYYGKEYELLIESDKGKGTKVSFVIPFIRR